MAALGFGSAANSAYAAEIELQKTLTLLKYDPYSGIAGGEVTHFTSNLLSKVGKGLSTLGVGLEISDAYKSFRDSNPMDGISYTTGAIGGTIGIFVPIIGVTTAVGSLGRTGIKIYYNSKSNKEVTNINNQLAKEYQYLYNARSADCLKRIIKSNKCCPIPRPAGTP